MVGVLRWGDRDMFQPSDLTREKTKRKILQTLFFFLFVRMTISTLERGLIYSNHEFTTEMFFDRVCRGINRKIVSVFVSCRGGLSEDKSSVAKV
jgi:hypothetical protein